MTLKDWLRKSIIGPHYIVVIFMMAAWSVFAVRSYIQIQSKQHAYVKQSADMISTAHSQHNRVVVESVLETLLSQGGAIAAEVCEGSKQTVGVNANLTSCLSGADFYENIIAEKIPGSATLILRARFSLLSDLQSVLSGLGFALILVFCGIYFIQSVQTKIKEDLFEPILNNLLGNEELKISELSVLRASLAEARTLEAQKAVTLAIQENNQQVAHDIRGPVQSISALLKMAQIDDQELKSALEKAVLRASSVANQLLESDRAVEPVEAESSYDLAALLNEIAKEKRPLFGGGRIKVVSPAACFVRCKLGSESLSRILSNLVDNSILASDHDRRIVISLAVEADSAVIEVKDHGCGIEPAALENVGNKGYSYRKNKKTKGTGRGIFSARSLLQKCGGTLEISSVPVMGTTVSTRLPIEPVANANDSDFILIDDDSIHRMGWKLWAKQNGYQLGTYSTAEEFLEGSARISHRTPVFIDSDLGTGLTGLELAEKITRIGFNRLILATAHRNIDNAASGNLEAIIGKDPAAALPFLKPSTVGVVAHKIDFA